MAMKTMKQFFGINAFIKDSREDKTDKRMHKKKKKTYLSFVLIENQAQIVSPQIEVENKSEKSSQA